ncbi:CIC11C00000003524 [Sungouiella intermedia]|uniref:CIC11C00000003524 n=1 Tax=Sungouiella intermedia TaxID=45354 RepID=A0A1L0BU91_9ASCO|nr:CIC11C00000003524 [[Candida] intermedia]
MNTLKDSKSVNSPDPDMYGKSDTPQSARKPKTPLKKDELEKIAKELKLKLSKASVAAKQLLTSSTAASSSQGLPPGSPLTLMSPPKSSPLKNYYMWKRQIAAGNTPALTLLPNLYSPDRKLPTLTKPSVFLSSSPLKSIAESGPNSKTRKSSIDTHSVSELNDSPIKRRRADSGAPLRVEPHMVLEEMPGGSGYASPSKSSLHPSPVLTSNALNRRLSLETPFKNAQTTPTLPKTQLANHDALLKTPTQPSRDNYNDLEGADLLMYLATSPSPAKPYGTTPRASSAPNGTTLATGSMHKPASSNLFIAPPPPLTPKRPMFSTAKTPQSRLTPSVYGNLAVPGSALPSAGLALTPAGFNMSDYVNFFTPSPGGAASQGSAINKSFLKTPDFHGLVQASVPKTPVDGKMINFDKVGLFGLSGTDPSKE